jgi:activator of HSP90 ATPase
MKYLKDYKYFKLFEGNTISTIEVEPGKINQSWRLSRTEDVLKWKKEFIINSY